jgi:hypothetical protein
MVPLDVLTRFFMERCDPEPTEPPVNAAESVRNEFSFYPSEQIDGVVDDASGWDWASHTPAVAPVQTPGMVTSNSRIYGDSWQQEQFDSTEEALPGNSHQIHRPSAMPLETHLGQSNNSGHNRHASVYPQVWSSPSPPLPNPSVYMPAVSNSNTDPHNFQMGIHEMTDEGSSASGSGNGGTRHIQGQSQPIWLPANQNTVPQGSNSGALYIHSMPSSSLYSSANHHAYADRDEGTSSAPSHSHYPLDFAATLECASQSTSQNPYASIPCSQPYEIGSDVNEIYEYYHSMQG